MQEEDLSGTAEDYLEKTERACDEAVEIIEKVRTLRELTEKEEKGEVELISFIEDVTDNQRDVLEKINIELERQKEEIKVQGGPLLAELSSNLIENAVKHADCDKIKISVKEGEDKNIVTVEDDGGGIPDEDKGKIFEKGFKSSETGGSGLGLYLVEEIVESYGGNVEVKDSELGGTRFDVHLKRAS